MSDINDLTEQGLVAEVEPGVDVPDGRRFVLPAGMAAVAHDTATVTLAEGSTAHNTPPLVRALDEPGTGVPDELDAGYDAMRERPEESSEAADQWADYARALVTGMTPEQARKTLFYFIGGITAWLEMDEDVSLGALKTSLKMAVEFGK